MKRYLGLSELKIFTHRVRSFYRNARYYINHIAFDRSAKNKLRQIKDSKNNQKAFVFGNGPSLQKLSKSKVKKYMKEEGYDLFATNSYLYADISDELAPSHYLLSDPNWFEPSKADFEEEFRDEIRTTLDNLEKIKPKLFIPFHEKDRKLPTETYYFNDSENLFSDNVTNLLQPRGYNSKGGRKALAIASYMGYEKIYMCGIDLSQFKELRVDQENNVYMEYTHFFENREKTFREHFSRSMGHQLYNFHWSFKTLEKFSHLPIVNLDPEGLVDVFPKRHELDVYK